MLTVWRCFDVSRFHTPPTPPRPRQRWSMADDGSWRHFSFDWRWAPRSAAGWIKWSKRRATGLRERPSRPSDKNSKSYQNESKVELGRISRINLIEIRHPSRKEVAPNRTVRTRWQRNACLFFSPGEKNFESHAGTPSVRKRPACLLARSDLLE